MFPPGTLITLGLFLVRTSAFVLATPFFGATTTFSGVKVGLIGALSLAAFTAHGVPIPDAVGPLAFGAFAMREVLIGMALAFALQAAVLAVRVAGELIGQEMAFNIAGTVDPVGGVNTPLITEFYEGLFLLGLLAVDGHHLLLRALAQSFVVAPVGSLSLGHGLAEGIVQLVSDMFAAGITFAAPVLMLLFLSSLLIAVLARAVPQINIMEVGFTLRISIGLLALLVCAPLIAPALGKLYAAFGDALDGLLAMIGS